MHIFIFLVASACVHYGAGGPLNGVFNSGINNLHDL